MDDEHLTPPSMPWDCGTSIYHHIRSHLNTDGALAPEAFELPDAEQDDGTRVRFGAGAMDGIASHHFGAGDAVEAERSAATLLDQLREYATTPTAANKLRLYQSFNNAKIIGLIDPFLRLARTLGSGVLTGRASELARSLATGSHHRGPVKFGVALLGLFNRREDVGLLQTLGRHDEFTLFCAVAPENHDDADQQLSELARHVRGWGRVHTVERLVRRGAAERIPALRDWLLREGYRNNVMTEYLACPCAIAGQLKDALAAAEVDGPLLEAAADLLDALAVGGPAEGMADYPDAAKAIRWFVRHVGTRGATLRQFNAVARVASYLRGTAEVKEDVGSLTGLTPQVSRELANRCGKVLDQPHWRTLVIEELQTDDSLRFHHAAVAAGTLGIDTWPVHWRRLLADPLDASRWHPVMRRCDAAKIQDAIDLALRSLPLEQIAAGPGRQLGLGPEYRPHACLDSILQELRRFPGSGGPLVWAALRSPVIRNRNFALRALSAWGESHWPPGTRDRLLAAAAAEPDEKVRRRIADVIEGRPLQERNTR